jgi:hypothetical protein
LRALVRVHAAVGDENATRKALVEALEAHRILDRNRSLPGLLETAARMEQESEAAPKLLGSAKAMRERWCAAVPPAESDEHARCHAAVRAAWDAPEFERLFAAGHALDRDAAIETALALVCRSSA